MIDPELGAAFERFKQDTELQAKLQAGLQRSKQDTAYLQEHYRELIEQYPEQWVAIYNQEVVGASPDYEQLLEELVAKGVPVNHGVFEHLTRKPRVWIL